MCLACSVLTVRNMAILVDAIYKSPALSHQRQDLKHIQIQANQNLHKRRNVSSSKEVVTVLLTASLTEQTSELMWRMKRKLKKTYPVS